jgi:putative exporter of polyketide antibiotics
MVIAFVANLVVWIIAALQHIDISFTSLVFGGLSILGPVIFILGAGTLVMGMRPRWATAVMYLIIGWSFTIDIVSSALKLNTYISDTSLLHHLALVPAATPKWGAFSIMAVSGIVMMIVGVLLFRGRDLQAE